MKSLDTLIEFVKSHPDIQVTVHLDAEMSPDSGVLDLFFYSDKLEVGVQKFFEDDFESVPSEIQAISDSRFTGLSLASRG